LACVSRRGARGARWARNEIFYRTHDSLMVTSVSLADEPTIGAPKLLFTGDFASIGFEPLWDVSTDGSRFAFVSSPNVGQTQFSVLMNWVDHWKARQRK